MPVLIKVAIETLILLTLLLPVIHECGIAGVTWKGDLCGTRSEEGGRAARNVGPVFLEFIKMSKIIRPSSSYVAQASDTSLRVVLPPPLRLESRLPMLIK